LVAITTFREIKRAMTALMIIQNHLTGKVIKYWAVFFVYPDGSESKAPNVFSTCKRGNGRMEERQSKILSVALTKRKTIILSLENSDRFEVSLTEGLSLQDIPNEQGAEESAAPKPTVDPNSLFWELGLSVRALKAIRRVRDLNYPVEFDTLLHLSKTKKSVFADLKACGPKTLNEIERLLDAAGLSFQENQ
jgi:hypothetical protein